MGGAENPTGTAELHGQRSARHPHNIVTAIRGGEPHELPFVDLHALCILDAGQQGMIMATDRIYQVLGISTCPVQR